MAARYHTLVIDLDGTLLARDGSVSIENRRAIERAREHGLEVIIATGRALVESLPAIEAIEHDGLVVAGSGSLLCEAATGRTIDRRVLAHEVVHHVGDALIAHGHKLLVLKDAHATGYDYLAVGPGELDPASKWWFSRLRAQLRFADELHEDEHPQDTVRAGVVAREDELAPLAEALKLEIGERAFLQHWSAVTESEATGSNTHLLEVFCQGVNKWTMIEAYCCRHELDPQRVAAIGDGLNDIELVANAGLGIAMANADERVKGVAGQLTDDHDHHGVAKAIGHILDGAW
jgi:5-amino-6-(5-phospho-D-ribitylamino)uracil phosphatase